MSDNFQAYADDRCKPCAHPGCQTLGSIEPWRDAAGVSTDAECYTWGCNELGQLGYTAGESKHVPTKMDILRGWDVKAIACGYAFHQLATTTWDSP